MRTVNYIRASLLAVCIVFFSGAILFGCQPHIDEGTPEKRLGSLLLSRGGIIEVQQYKDDTAIHGPTYFYFQSSPESVERLIFWLGLRRHKSIPDVFSSSIKATVGKKKWNFDVSVSQIYLTYYCRPFDGSNWSMDLLLVNDRNVIFITEGYVPQNSTRYDDPSKCNSQ